jgi:hypothetical protein
VQVPPGTQTGQQFQDEGKTHGFSSPVADSFFQRVKEFFGKDEG